MAKRRKNHLPPFVYITKEMLRSDAFKRLTNASRIAYLLLKSQCCKADQNEVKCPYSEAIKYMHKSTFSQSISQLIELGFIKKEQQGGLYRKINVYTFSDAWRLIGMA